MSVVQECCAWARRSDHFILGPVGRTAGHKGSSGKELIVPFVFVLALIIVLVMFNIEDRYAS